jgi:tetratricopeptide (TPR) repeat protein
MAAWSTIAGTAVAQQPSDADRQEAARLAREGEQHGNKNELREALFKFKQAARLDPTTPAYLCNVGLAYYGVNDFPRAHLNLSRCYQATGTWPAGVREVFAFIEGELSRRDYAQVTITGVPEDAVIALKAYEDEGELRAPLKVYLPAGNYIYEASATGYKIHYGEIRVVDRTPLQDQYRLQPAEATGGGRTTGGGGGQVGGGVDLGGDPVIDEPRGGSSKKTLGYVALGGGAALGIGGTIAIMSAKGKLDDFIELNDARMAYRQDGTLTEEGKALESAITTRQAIAWSLWGVGAAAAGVGIFLLVTGDDGAGDERPLVSAAPTEGGGMVWMTWQR